MFASYICTTQKNGNEFHLLSIIEGVKINKILRVLFLGLIISITSISAEEFDSDREYGVCKQVLFEKGTRIRDVHAYTSVFGTVIGMTLMMQSLGYTTTKYVPVGKVFTQACASFYKKYKKGDDTFSMFNSEAVIQVKVLYKKEKHK